MPKIDARTVAEHRAAKEREILDAAIQLIDTGQADGVTIKTLAGAVGLSRSAFYKYFSSLDDIRWRIIEDSFAGWTSTVSDRVSAAATPHEAIRTYVVVTLSLADQGAHRIAMQADQLRPSDERNDQLNTLHELLRAPLTEALAAIGTPDEVIVASLVDAMLGRAIQMIDAGENPASITRLTLELVEKAAGINLQGHKT